MERSVEVLCVVLFAITGLSHLLQPRAWVEFFTLLRNSGKPGAFADGFLNLHAGSMILAFHRVWTGIPLVLTLLGCALVLKSVLRFCAPALAVRMMGRVSMERAWEFQLAGAGLIALAGVIGYGLYAA